MFIQLSKAEERENGEIYFKRIFVNTDKIIDFFEDTFTDSFGKDYTFTTVEFDDSNSSWIRVKETIEEIGILIGVKLII